MTELFLPEIADGEDKSSPFKNRIRKNYRHVRKWAKRTQTNCFRVYDRDIKEYPLAIDFYAGKFCVQYFSYDRDTDEPPPERVLETEDALYSIFGASPKDIYQRTRLKRTRIQQYEKIASEKEFFIVQEYGIKFKVNLHDYLDSGLFLDHRETRRLVATYAQGKSLLNLFAYTCSFSVHAALNGAASTTSIDMSNTYTAWGRENFELNGIAPAQHSIVRADCLKWLEDAIKAKLHYQVIVIDPPTLSRSKKMEEMFEIQTDLPAPPLSSPPSFRKGGQFVFQYQLS